MAEIDPETLERVRRWCAEAGREAGAAEIRAALAPLTWDEFLLVRALLADRPIARPLGPQALADIARGALPEVAAEREREGRYEPERGELAPKEPPPEEAGPPRGRRRSGRTAAPPVVRRKRAHSSAAPHPEPSPPPLRRLLEPSGRTILEGFVRRHGARRPAILRELSAFRREDGAPPADGDLDALLDHHGLSRAFAHREREELLHALRAARGERAPAAESLGVEGGAYWASLERLGAVGEAERIRDERRAELRARATLAERCRLVARDVALLEDLGLLAEFEADLAARLPEHLRALRAGQQGSALDLAFANTVGLPAASALALARRIGLDLGSARGLRPLAGRGEKPRLRSRAGPAEPGTRPARRGPSPRRRRGRQG